MSDGITNINHPQMMKVLKKAYKTGIACFISGTTGIGKSMTVKEFAIETAREEEREYVEWNAISDKENIELLEKEDKRVSSFILADIRTALLDPSDLRGLPKLNGKDYVEWKPNMLFRVFATEGTKGILFFDELNLAPPSIMASAYQIILDNSIGEMSFNRGTCRIACGNRVEDFGNVYEMGIPLKARFTHYTLGVPSVDEWMKWALKNNVDDRIIAFLKFQEQHLMADLKKIKTSKSDAVACPRTWYFLSEMIKGEEDIKDIEMFSYGAVGQAIGMVFSAFVKLNMTIDVNDYLKYPKKAEGMSLEMTWALISAIAGKFRTNKQILDDIFGFDGHMEKDHFCSMLSMARSQISDKGFTRLAINSKNWNKISDKYQKYISRDE